jgi:putative 4-mercaptohistidine N1-methyltranferase
MTAIYESPKLLSEYLLFHYGGDDEILPPGESWPPGMREALGFPVRTVAHFQSGPAVRGLDLGCAVGRSTFEMSRTCRHVIGMDFSHAFIAAAETLRRGETIGYSRQEEAASATPLTACLPAGIQPSRVAFFQGDAMNLPPDLGAFDRVHAANLLCRLSDPPALLARLPGLVAPDGELVIATPCTWLEEFTPPARWPEHGTLPWLLEHLGPHFDLVRQADESFLIRETARKFQWTRSLVTVWHRRP